MFVDKSVVQETVAIIEPCALFQLNTNILVKEVKNNISYSFFWLVPCVVGENTDQHVSERRLR